MFHHQRAKKTGPCRAGFPCSTAAIVDIVPKTPTRIPRPKLSTPTWAVGEWEKKSPEIVTEITEMPVEYNGIHGNSTHNSHIATRFTISMGWTGHSSPEGVSFLEPAINLTAYAPRLNRKSQFSLVSRWFLMVSHGFSLDRSTSH